MKTLSSGPLEGDADARLMTDESILPSENFATACTDQLVFLAEQDIDEVLWCDRLKIERMQRMANSAVVLLPRRRNREEHLCRHPCRWAD